MKIGIFGGSFNPPHNMHKRIALTLLKNKMLDKVIYVPTGNYYQKKDLIDIKHRLNMLRILFNNTKNIEVSELSQSDNYQYTYQVLDYYQKKYKNDEIYFICGSDNLKEFKSWKNYEFILSNYQLIVIKRNQDNIDAILEEFKKYKNRIFILDLEKNPISSTILREDKNLRKNYLDKNVLKYIQENHLYEK